MGKTMISSKPRKSLKNTQEIKRFKLKEGVVVHKDNSVERLMDEDFIAKAIWECLKDNDLKGVIEVIHTHLAIVNKVKASKEVQLSRATMYNAIKGKNPTLKTLCKLIHCCCIDSYKKESGEQKESNDQKEISDYWPRFYSAHGR